jgi:hypothetical protein
LSRPEILDDCGRHFVMVTQAGDDLEVTPVFPDTHPMLADLVHRLRLDKPRVVAWLKWDCLAESMLSASVDRLAAAWVPGSTVEGPEWERCEADVQRAYLDQDEASLRRALEAREAHAISESEKHMK